MINGIKIFYFSPNRILYNIIINLLDNLKQINKTQKKTFTKEKVILKLKNYFDLINQ